MMKFKRINIIIITILFFTIIWFTQNLTYTDIFVQQSSNMTSYGAIIFMNNSAFGYSSMQAYALFYTIPFIIFLNHFFLPERIVGIIRESNRDKLYLKRLFKIIITALLISSIHTSVNLLFTNIFFEYDLLKEIDFTTIGFLNTLGLFLFYISVGIIYEIIKDLSHSVGISFFITIVLIGGLFFFDKLYIGESESWGPLRDVVIYSKLLEKEWTYKYLALVYMRQFFIVIFFYLIGSFIYKRKDWI